MKNIDIKSLLIGGLLASTILLGIAAAPWNTSDRSPDGKWDENQRWHIKRQDYATADVEESLKGFEPFALTANHIYYRKRMK